MHPMSVSNATNPLLHFEFQIPFDRIRAEHVDPAVQELLKDARTRLDALTSDPNPRTYENTMQVLDHLTDQLEYAMGIVRHLESVATYPELRVAFNAVQPAVSAFYASLPLNEALWKTIQAYAATGEAQHLEGTRKRFLKKTIDSFRRQGAELDPAGKKRLAEIDVELATITTKYGENVLDSTNAFEYLIKNEADLAGLPPTAVAAARASAASKGMPEGAWRFTLQAPSYNALMTYLDDGPVREHLYHANVIRATQGAHDNRPIVRRILELRKERATLLGFRDFADLVLEERMAHSGARAHQFLADLKSKTEAQFQRENEELRVFAGKPELHAWDVAYYSEKLRQALYDFDEEALRPYFPLERVVSGMFEIVHRLYGIEVVERPGAPVWDPAVKYYEIRDQGRFVGAFYADWYPRENKRGGAWMDAFITGVVSKDRSEPHAGLICGNLTPPVEGKPALLTHREVETIFHEFGHLLHHSLSRVEVRSLAGTNVAWDFVELPSQIMENWCWEREALDLFAAHYETGEPIPADLFDKMKRARRFRAANVQMRQLGFGYVDLALHREYSPERDGDPIAYARNLAQQFAPTKLPSDHAMIASFTHLFSSPVGYGAGYYSYKWAEVLDADAFSRFREHGIFSREVGQQFRERILSKGDSEDPAELYREFMGRDPDPDALLRRSGLLAA
jgi:oligopeptidase A